MKRTLLILIAGAFLLTIVSGCGDDDPTSVTTLEYSSVENYTLAVSDNPILTVDDFVGGISVVPGVSDTIRVTATRRAAREQDLNKIVIAVTSTSNEIDITAQNPSELQNVEADFEISVPPGTKVELISDVGNILYRGRPRDINRFNVGVGSIALYLPANVNVYVDLSVSVGSVSSSFIVDGTVSNTRILGLIGSGADGEIRASTNVGNIEVLSY